MRAYRWSGGTSWHIPGTNSTTSCCTAARVHIHTLSCQFLCCGHRQLRWKPDCRVWVKWLNTTKASYLGHDRRMSSSKRHHLFAHSPHKGPHPLCRNLLASSHLGSCQGIISFYPCCFSSYSPSAHNPHGHGRQVTRFPF